MFVGRISGFFCTLCVPIIISILLAQGCGPGEIAGIDSPLTIGKARLYIMDAWVNPNVSIGGSGNKTIMVQLININTESAGFGSWDIWLTDENDARFDPGLVMPQTFKITNVEGKLPDYLEANREYEQLIIGFGVTKESNTITLHLPQDNTIDIDSLLKE
jgi:hypothetical protein